MPKPKKKFEKSKKPARPPIFDIETFKNWKIEKTDRRCYLLTCPDAIETFKFSIGINTSLEVEMDIIYCEQVVMYRGRLGEHMKKFWYELGSKLFRDEEYDKELLKRSALNNYDWVF